MKKCFIVFLLILTACGQLNKSPSVLTDYTCGVLCWNGITIGKTSKDELINILASLAIVDSDSIKMIEKSWNIFDESVYFSAYKNWSSSTPLVQVEARILNQKVSMLTFRGSLGVNFQDIVDVFGDPELVFAIKNHEGNVDIDLINSLQGVRFGFTAQDENSSITPNSKVTLLQLFDTNLFQKMLEESLLTSAPYSTEEFNIYSWTGYGIIKINYWPPGKPR